MKSLLLSSLACLSLQAYAQNEAQNPKYAVKLYNQTSFSLNEMGSIHDTNSISVSQNGKSVQILHPTIALEWKNKRKDIHEIELTNFDWSNNNSGIYAISAGNDPDFAGKIAHIALGLRYEYKLMFNKKRDHKLQPSIGFAALPFYKYDSYKPGNTTHFAKSQTSYGISAFVVPGVNYNLTSRFFIDANAPVCLGIAAFETTKSKNTALPLAAQNSSIFNFDGGVPMVALRLGVGLRI